MLGQVMSCYVLLDQVNSDEVRLSQIISV